MLIFFQAIERRFRVTLQSAQRIVFEGVVGFGSWTMRKRIEAVETDRGTGVVASDLVAEKAGEGGGQRDGVFLAFEVVGDFHVSLFGASDDFVGVVGADGLHLLGDGLGR